MWLRAGDERQGSLPPPEEHKVDLRDMGFVTRFIGALVGAGLVAQTAYAIAINGSSFAAPLLWCLALLVSAMAVGFLFGVPKVVQGDWPTGPSVHSSASGNLERRARDNILNSGYDQKVNTNLEEISDWLTKIIVGLGLVQLKELPGNIDTFTGRIAECFSGPGSYRSAALAMVLFFAPAGFLYGYLMTRLYLQGALARAEGVNAAQEEVLQKANAALFAAAGLTARRASFLKPDDSAGDIWNSDPYKGFAGGLSERNSRRLTAEIRPITNTGSVNRVHLEVASTDPRKPLTQPVKFLLHPTFEEAEVTQMPDKDGVARLDILSEGEFTVAAETDGGDTRLELDLAEVPGGSTAFYQN